MMAYIRGSVKDLQDGIAIVVPAGAAVGYEIRVGPRLRVNWDCELWVWETFSADKGSALFGFASPDDRRLAQRLTDVQGIGPVIAHRIVTTMGADAVIAAIARGDAKALSSGVGKGLGPKGASNIVTHLKEAAKALSVEGAGDPRLPRVIAALETILPTGDVNTDALAALATERPEATDAEIVRFYLASAKGGGR